MRVKLNKERFHILESILDHYFPLTLSPRFPFHCVRVSMVVVVVVSIQEGIPPEDWIQLD